MCGADVAAKSCLTFGSDGYERRHYKADGTACAMCSKPGQAIGSIVGCSKSVDDTTQRIDAALHYPQITVSCVDSCEACPLVKCFASGGGMGEEIDCDLIPAK
jgi:hypothetical protein